MAGRNSQVISLLISFYIGTCAWVECREFLTGAIFMTLRFEPVLQVQEGLEIEVTIQMDIAKDNMFMNVQILIPYSSSPPTEIRFYRYYIP